jgi:Cof subfamily protein (haloacid dehalogenase superfamily)
VSRDGRLPPRFDPRRVRAVAMDLDRTILPASLELSPATVAAVAAAQEAGIAAVVATGRMLRSALPFAERLGVTAPLICYQGALVADPRSGEWLRHEPVPVPLAREVVEALGEAGLHVNLYVDDRIYVERMSEEAATYAAHSRLETHVVGPLLDWLSEPTTKIVAVGEPDELDLVQPRLRERFGRRLFIAKSLPDFLEIAVAGVSKGSGLRFVCERLGIEPEAVVAFGDGQNDIELLEEAGLGVAMADADERLLARADWTVPGVEEDGVAGFLEALVDCLR